jgi:integrase
MGSVHHINDGKNRRKPYRARVPSHVDLNIETGKATQKYITIGYFETEIEAIEALMEYRKNPYTFEASTATFSDVFEMWKARKYQGISKAAKSVYDAAYKNSEKLHNLRMKDIRAAHMDEIMQNIPYGFQVQSKLKTFWGQLFKYAMENDIIQKNYAEFVKIRDKDEGTKRTAIPAEDRAKLWAAADEGNHDAEIALIYLYTGMRPSELLELRKENINLDSRIMIGGMKTEAGKDRHIPIYKDILPFITRLMQTDGEYLIMRYDKGKPQKMAYQRFYMYHWKPLMEILKMEDYTPHYGRHTCATMLREAGVQEDLRKLILGHASGDITDRYTHISDTMLVEAIDMIPSRA